MGVFDSRNRVSRKLEDGGTDRAIPSPELLAWQRISQETALTNTSGVDCEIVRGDHWEEFCGSVVEHTGVNVQTRVDGNDSQSVRGKQEILICGNHKETLSQTCHQRIFGPQLVLNGTARNETRLGTYMEIYGETEFVEGCNSLSDSAPLHKEDYGASFVLHGVDIQLYGAQLGFVLAQAQAVVASAAARLLDAAYTTAHGELTGMHLEIHLDHNEVHGSPKPTAIPPGEPPLSPLTAPFRALGVSHQPPCDATSHIS